MKKRTVTVISLTILSFTVISVLAIIIGIAYFGGRIDLEMDEKLFDIARTTSSTRYFAPKDPYSSTYDPVELNVSKSTDVRKHWYSLKEIPSSLKEGIIAVEDREFYNHKGFNLKRTIAAAVNHLFKKEKTFGASTITQQVIKNISGDNEQTVSRKISEIIRATHIEKIYTKDEILEVYLNIIPLSEGIVGVGAASRYYFDKEPKELTEAEAATLIGITNAPSKFNPIKNTDACINKRNSVLKTMLNEGVIDNDTYSLAIIEELNTSIYRDGNIEVNSWFIETVINDIVNDLSKKYGITKKTAEIIISSGGLNVFTTVDKQLQDTLEKYFENEKNFSKEIFNGLNYGFVVSDSKTNNLLGIIGRVGKKQGNKLLNQATVNHIPGSTLKPLALYAPLIDSGKISWSTVFDDVPLEFTVNEKGEYTLYPKNSPNRYDGLINTADAIKKSKNTVAVNLYNMLGAEKIYEDLKNDYGFDTLVRNKTVGEKVYSDLSSSPLALGQLTYGIPLRKLTESYTVFPSEGLLKEGRSYLYVTDREGNVILDKQSNEKRILKPETARIMNQMLSGVVTDGTARSITLNEIVDTAGKTGTSGGSKDKLFIGYTPYYTIGIWTGYDSSDKNVNVEPTHLDIWNDLSLSIHKYRLNMVNDENIESFSVKGLKMLEYCYDSGKILSDKCEYDPRGSRKSYGYFTEDYEIKEICDVHVLVDYDMYTEGVSRGKCPEDHIKKVALLDIKERYFPIEIFITDAEFCYKKTEPEKFSNEYAYPYYYGSLGENEFIGLSKKKKQFNSGCYIHY